jgi:hypothetical protein
MGPLDAAADAHGGIADTIPLGQMDELDLGGSCTSSLNTVSALQQKWRTGRRPPASRPLGTLSTNWKRGSSLA